MSNQTIICGNPACRVAETGKCVEGLVIDDCPQYGRESGEQTVADADFGEAELTLMLPNGQALSVARATSVLVQKESRVIAVIGPRETGKTSLVASIYDLFQTGSIGDISFARSRTLQAFELACHDARAASRRGTPHMERTKRGQVLFYHLELCGGCAKDGVALLLADRSGEEYTDVADDISAADELVEVERADAVTFLIDGARLMDAGRRHNIRMDVTMIAQGLVESGVLRNDHRVALVLTKLDLIQASEQSKRVLADFEGLHSHLSKTLEGKIGRFEMFKIAASPADGALKRGTGIEELMQFWLEDGPDVLAVTRLAEAPQRAFSRIKPLEN